MPPSVQRAGRQHEAQRWPSRGRVATVHPRAVKPPAASRGHVRVGRPVVFRDPVHDRGEVGAFGEDRSSLDNDSARRVRARQSGYECVDLEIVHSSHGSGCARQWRVIGHCWTEASCVVADDAGRSHKRAAPIGRPLADSENRVRAVFLFFARANAANRSRVVRKLALRPGFSPHALMPPTTRVASRGGRRELLVLTAGSAGFFVGATYRPRRFPTWSNPPRALPRARTGSGSEGRKDMTRAEHDPGTRRRGSRT
jgi:hypothetical protein